MKFLKNLIIIIIILIVAAVFGRNFIIKTAAEQGVKKVTGLPLKIASFNMGLSSQDIGIKGLQLFNPPNYPDKLMVDAPEIYVQYNFNSLLKKEVYLPHVKFHLKEFVVVKTKDGQINVNSIKAVKSAKQDEAAKTEEKKDKAKMPPLKIDLLELQIEKVILKDYSQGGQPVVREFNVGINETYHNITDPYALARLIVVRAMQNTTISQLTGLDLNSVKGAVNETLKGMEGIATGTLKGATGTLKETTNELKNIITSPFGK
jgi:hypothetical protein